MMVNGANRGHNLPTSSGVKRGRYKSYTTGTYVKLIACVIQDSPNRMLTFKRVCDQNRLNIRLYPIRCWYRPTFRIWTDYEKAWPTCFRRPKKHWEQHQSLSVIKQLLLQRCVSCLHFIPQSLIIYVNYAINLIWSSLIGTSRPTISKSHEELLESGRERHYSKNASPSFQLHNRQVSWAIPSDTPDG